jgi:hypothetical protein
MIPLEDDPELDAMADEAGQNGGMSQKIAEGDERRLIPKFATALCRSTT